jgi:adenosylcobinamide-GDP ribazoletransferase
VIPAVALLGWVTFLPLASVFVVTWMIGQTALKRIGGCTGDLYGAMIELAEIVTLLCLLLPEVRKLCA